MDTQVYINKFMEFAWNFGPKILLALSILVIGLWLIRRLVSGLDAVLRARKVDESLRPFFHSLLDVALKVALLLVVASTIGLETTSFIAIFSAIAFSVGLALQGSLGNFASGVLILLFKPYKVGDNINVGGMSGKVVEIQIFNTILETQKGKKIIIPNGKMTEGAIENIGEKTKVQASISLLLSPKTSLEWLRAIAAEIYTRCPFHLEGTVSEVKIGGISRDDMKVEFSFWVLGENFDHTVDYMWEEFKKTLEASGVELAKERRKEAV
jgi:small conductance mechanosensitive channel